MLRIALKFVTAFHPPTDDSPLGFAGEQRLADSAPAGIKLLLTAPAAERVSGIFGGNLELAGTSGIPTMAGL